MHKPPYKIVLKPYGQALASLMRQRPEIVCLGADLTRQTETDIVRDGLGDRFINVGMAEANMMCIAGGLARAGRVVFVNSFGVFCTRRCYDQVAMSIAYPNLNVKIVGFMPGLSSPGGPSHQAIEDVALMRALPNMAVVEPADAIEVKQAVAAIADHPGPVYLRLKRGEIPAVFEEDHRLEMNKAQVLMGAGSSGGVCIIAAGMMIPAALAAADLLSQNEVPVAIMNVPVIKPLDADTIVAAARGRQLVVTAENHTVIGGLGSAVAEALAEAGLGIPLRRVGIADVFAESGSREFLFGRYGLGVQDIVNAAWRPLRGDAPAPVAPRMETSPGAYAPV